MGKYNPQSVGHCSGDFNRLLCTNHSSSSHFFLVYVQLLSHQGFRLSTLTFNTSRHTITRLHLNVNLTVGKPPVKTYTHVGTWTHTFFKADEKLIPN